MIKIFRRIRQRLLNENRFRKYLIYATGEIFLVVIGILIALQINNWNNNRIDENELDGLLKTIAGGVQTDLKNLDLLSNARESISVKADSVFDAYILTDLESIRLEEAAFIVNTFNDVLKPISFKPNLNAFEALNNSTFIGKIQGTDLASLLNAYYSSAEVIQNLEETYNENLEVFRKEWQNKFRDKDQSFLRFWNNNASNFLESPVFFEILRDNTVRDIFSSGFSEAGALRAYEEQSLMGTKLVEMIKSNRTAFDLQTKLDFSGILYSFGDADYLSVLINGEQPTGFNLLFASSHNFKTGGQFKNIDDYLEINYPDKAFDWAAAYFYVSALNGRVNEMDFSSYSKVSIEMKGDVGGEVFQLTMKDKNDPPDGTESRIPVELTKEWKVYEFDLSNFKTADLQLINVPLSFVFQGPKARKIHLRSVQFK